MTDDPRQRLIDAAVRDDDEPGTAGVIADTLDLWTTTHRYDLLCVLYPEEKFGSLIEHLRSRIVREERALLRLRAEVMRLARSALRATEEP